MKSSTVSQTIVLSCRGVTKRFAGITALNAVSLELRAGSILGIIGPNGSGKTTLLNCLSGVLTPDDGRVELVGTEVTRLRADKRCRAGIARTFQNLRVFNSLSVIENLRIGAHATGRKQGSPVRVVKYSLDQVLELLSLGPVGMRAAGGLPYGLQRRVEIGRALMSEPRVLLLDEPVAGMNDEEAENMQEIFTDVAAGGTGILLIEHNVGFVRGLCRRLIALDAGTVLAEGDPEEVLGNGAVREAYLG